jgi:uncharacterized repeat protein (TIGR01451 family)
MSSARRLHVALLASALLASGAVAQEESPSFTERLSRLGRNLFGPREDRATPPASREVPVPRSPGFANNPSRPPVRGADRFSTDGTNDTSTPPASNRSSRRTAQPGYARNPNPPQIENAPRTVQAPFREQPLQRPSTRAEFPPKGDEFDNAADSDLSSSSRESSQPISHGNQSDTDSSETFVTDEGVIDSSPVVRPGLSGGRSGRPVVPAAPSSATEDSIQDRLNDARRVAPPASPPRDPSVEKPVVGTATASPLPAARPAIDRPVVASPPNRPAEKLSTTPPPTAISSPLSTKPSVLFSAESPALTLETSGPQKIKVGVVAAYGVTLRNTGHDADDVVVTIKLPEGADLVNTHPSEGTLRPGTSAEGGPIVEWMIPRLRAQAKAELGLRLIPRKSRPMDLAVHWRCAPIGSVAQIEVQEPKLLMSLSGPEEVFYGERELYKLTLSNPGNGDAENVMVRLLPTTPGEDQAVSHQIGLLRAGENKVVELELTARQVGTLRLKAEATADTGLHAAVDEEVIVRRADLKIQADGPGLLYAGTAGTYQIRLSNPGNAVAKNIQIAAVLPTGATYVSSTEGGAYHQDQGRILWSTTNLRPGAEWTCQFVCKLEHPGSNTTQIVASAEGDLRQIASANTDVEALADLALTVKDPTGPVPVGQEASYEVHVLNRGTKSATGIEVVAFFSPGIEPTAVEGGPHEVGPGQITMEPLASLAPGQEVVFTIKAKAHRAGNHIFRAEVSCPDLETKLAAEETTRFYGEDLIPDSSTSSVPPPVRSPEPQADFDDAPSSSRRNDSLVPVPDAP